MGLFGGKDWNIIAIIFERPDLFRVNGNRGKGKEADTMRDGAKNHNRTIYWAVFDQKGGFVEGDPGAGQGSIPLASLKQLMKDIPMNRTVRDMLAELEQGKTTKASKALEWAGYPKGKIES
ncbi:MAG TPA: hypothetical protein VHB77_17070 [Planctomycetaceae bacterium]|nr:hypothetical protein [Planctomycetaceae bacterium]